MKKSAARRSVFPVILDWILLPAAAVLFHILLFVLFVPTEQDRQTRSASGRFTLLLQEDSIRKGNDPYHLRYSLKYMDPETLILPDIDSGFSSILDRKKIKLPSPFHCRHGLFDDKAFFPVSAAAKLPGTRTLDQITGYSPPFSSVKNTVRDVPQPAVTYPVWSDQSGNVKMGFFMPDAPAQSLFRQYGNKTTDVTMLRVDVEEKRFPFIRILQSCGIPVLDQLAQRQLSSLRKHYELPPGVKSRSFLYRVTWKKPQISNLSAKGGAK